MSNILKFLENVKNNMQESDKNLIFSNNLKFLRNNAALSQVELAGILQMSRGAIGNYETGKEPGKKELKKIADYFNVSVHELLYERLNVNRTEFVFQVAEKAYQYNQEDGIPVVTQISANVKGYEEKEVIKYETIEMGIKGMFFLVMADSYLMDGSVKSIKQGDMLLIDPKIEVFYPGDLVAVITISQRQWVRYVEEIQEEYIKLQGNITLARKSEIAAIYRVVKVRPVDFNV